MMKVKVKYSVDLNLFYQFGLTDASITLVPFLINGLLRYNLCYEALVNNLYLFPN